MNRHDVATLGIRFSALYALFEALEYFTGGFINASMAQSVASGKANTLVDSLMFFLPSALLTIVGILLFTRAPRLAVYFLPESNESLAPSTAPAATPCVGFAIVGLAGCIYSAPHLVTIIVRLFRHTQTADNDFKTAFMAALPQISGAAFQFLLSFATLVKSRALATWWQNKQNKPAS